MRCRYDSGDYAAAGAGAEAIAAEFAGELRAESLLLRAIVAWSADEPGDVAVGAAERALAAAPPDSPLAGRVHAHLAGFRDAPEPARRHAEAERRRSEEQHEPGPDDERPPDEPTSPTDRPAAGPPRRFGGARTVSVTGRTRR
ncbi:hypothetical protein [Micromonospora sp. NPDC048830]|uniref:hypothetical protein n=1 Tax=Micromonospora sp. NPDC048830 TaxID=3364257 RepID=UPI0037108F5A